ncbi:MAG TPA: hypothetical protein VF043_29585 [Ktedonobacteraceae bacterium]
MVALQLKSKGAFRGRHLIDKLAAQFSSWDDIAFRRPTGIGKLLIVGLAGAIVEPDE